MMRFWSRSDVRLAKVGLGISVIVTAALMSIPSRGSAADLQLERVALVQRHGVRSPTQKSEVLKAWAEKDWPDWKVGPGELTSHGKAVVSLVAKTAGNEYRAKGLRSRRLSLMKTPYGGQLALFKQHDSPPVDNTRLSAKTLDRPGVRRSI